MKTIISKDLYKKTENKGPTLENGVMLPISKIVNDSNRIMYYVLYNTRTTKFARVKPREIQAFNENGYDIRGFGMNGRLNGYFNKLKALGVKDTKRVLCYSVSLTPNGDYLLLVDEAGIKSTMTREDATKSVANNELVIIGTVYDKDKNKLKISKDVQRFYANEEQLDSLETTERTELDDNMQISNGIISVTAK